jgi:hypothetical protein
MSTSFSSAHDQFPTYARRVHQHYPSSPPSSFGRAQGRCATATPTHAHDTSESSQYSQFSFSTSAISQSGVTPLSARQSPPPPAPAQGRPSSRQSTHPPPSRPSGLPAPSSDLQSPQSVASSLPSHAGSISGHSQQAHGAVDKRDFEMELCEDTFSSGDLQLDQAFIPSTSPAPKKGLRHPAYHYTPSTTVSPAAVSGNKIRERYPPHNLEAELHRSRRSVRLE